MSASYRVLETIPAEPGWRCVFAGTAEEPLVFSPVACWGVVDGIPGAAGPEVCPMVDDTPPGGLPRLTPLVRGAPGGCPPGFLGTARPDEPLDLWRERALAYLAGPPGDS